MPSRRSQAAAPRNRLPPPTTPTMSSAATASSSRPQRSTTGRSAQKVASYAEDDAAGEDESGEEDDDDDEGEEDAADEDDDATRLAGAVARHRQVAALAAGVSYTPDHKVRRPASASKPRHSSSSSSSNHKRISQARIDAIENVILPDQGDTGWMAEPASPQEAPHIFTYILHAIKAHVARGRRLAESIEHLPNDQNFLKGSDHPISLNEIEANIAQGEYQASRPFELDMLSMFTTFRRGYQIGTQPYADTVTLQRLYQRLTRRQTNQRFISVQTIMENHRTANPNRNFASVPFGPGEATRGQATDLTTRPNIRGKLYYTHAFHKGYTFRVGDWVQLMNATDPGKPTVAQIFKIAKREEERNDPPVLSCCWYYRPEQTVHPASRRFVAEEVFKTGLFADHPVDDVIEKTQVLFYTKWTRGRPGKNDWDPRSPLYFCEARYNERTYDFNKIKNWNSCLPEEQRGMEAPIIHFPEPHPQPNRIESPFLRGVKGPGRLCEEDEVGRGTGESPSRASQDIPDPFAERPRKKQRMEQQYQQSPSQGPSPPFGGNAMLPPGHSPYPPGGFPPRGAMTPGQRLPPMSHLGMAPPGPTQPNHQVLANAQAILQKMASTMPEKIGKGDFNRLQQLFAGPNARALDLQSLATGVSNRVDFVTLARWRDAMQAFVADMTLRGVAAAQSAGGPAVGGPPPPPGAAPPGVAGAPMYAHPARPAVVERNLASALGGIEAWCVPLPEATRDLFTEGVVKQEDKKDHQQPEAAPPTTAPTDGADTTATPAKPEDAEDNAPQVQWFAGPPMYATPKKSNARPAPSLAYLAHRASQVGGNAKTTGGAGGGEMATYLEELGLGELWDSLVNGARSSGDGNGKEQEEEDLESEETEETRALAQALLAAQ